MPNKTEVEALLRDFYAQHADKYVKITGEGCAIEADVDTALLTAARPLILSVGQIAQIVDNCDYIDLDVYGIPIDPTHPALTDDVARSEVQFRMATYSFEADKLWKDDSYHWKVVEPLG